MCVQKNSRQLDLEQHCNKTSQKDISSSTQWEENTTVST